MAMVFDLEDQLTTLPLRDLQCPPMRRPESHAEPAASSGRPYGLFHEEPSSPDLSAVAQAMPSQDVSWSLLP